MKSLAALNVLALTCWVVMFLAGHDVWHFAGSPDFWRASGPPNADLRAFACAFYGQFVVLAALLSAVMFRAARSRAARG